jgi:hypothetical protein
LATSLSLSSPFGTVLTDMILATFGSYPILYFFSLWKTCDDSCNVGSVLCIRTFVMIVSVVFLRIVIIVISYDFFSRIIRQIVLFS